MKKFEVDKYLEEDNFNGSEEYAYMRPCSEGNWVEADLAEEMLKALKEAHKRLTDWKHGGLPKDKQAQIEELLSNIIAKAEGA